MCAQSSIGAADVFKGSRPSAAGIAHATVFHVPCGDTGFFQCLTKMAGISEIVFGAPVAAVDEKDYRMRTLSRGHSNVGELVWVLAVRETQIRRRRFFIENGFALHAKKYKTACGPGFRKLDRAGRKR